ncbi:MAG: 50S ribosomal protein L24 [Sphaerochaetaceae bacterium]|nr:50S ribosomal protein L24 [Sphaerochaetaceae bacterium]
MKLKKNDTVKVMVGKDKGKIGKISKVDQEKEAVYILGVNMVSKAMKKKNQNDKGGITRIEAPIHVSNVALVVDQKAGTTSRIGYKLDEKGNKVRIAKKTGAQI